MKRVVDLDETLHGRRDLGELFAALVVQALCDVDPEALHALARYGDVVPRCAACRRLRSSHVAVIAR